MRDDVRDAPDTSRVGGVPTHCPACQSRHVMTASKVIDSDTYWRCTECGEVWNIKRVREASRYVTYRPFKR